MQPPNARDRVNGGAASSLLRGLLVGALSAAAVVHFTQLIPKWGVWYTTMFGIHFRQQTEALLRGGFALSPVPFGIEHDWAWANGAQQVWGLGVPLLRLPFEALARALGWVGFPDRLVLVGMLFLAALSLWRGLGPGPEAAAQQRPWTRGAAFYLLLFFPPFLSLLRSRMGTYEEVAAYVYLWQLLCLSLLLSLSVRFEKWTFFAACALAGYTGLLRPTHLAYGGMTLLLSLFLLWRQGGRRLWAVLGVLLFLAGPLALALTNVLRFGSPGEFGHSLNFTVIPDKHFAWKVGYPYALEPLGGAAKELFALLFLEPSLHGVDILNRGSLFHPWVSDRWRSRELYLTTFNLGWLSLWGAGVSLALWRFIRRAGRPAPGEDLRPLLLALWSLCCFPALFYFYLRTPSISSRYLLDFAPSMAAGVAAGLMALEGLPGRKAATRPWLSVAPALALTAWVSQQTARAEVYRGPSHPAPRLARVEEVQRLLSAFRPSEPRPLPEAYACPTQDLSLGISFNGSGWHYQQGCAVSSMTALFLEDVDCVFLEVESRLPPEQLAKTSFSFDDIRVKRQLEFLERREDTPLQSGGRRLVFCPRDADPDRARGYKTVFIGWLKREVLGQGNPPFRLLRMGKVPRPAAASLAPSP